MCAISIRRTKSPNDLEKIADFVFAFENPIETIGVYDSEGCLIEAIHGDRSVPRDVVLQQGKETRLLGRELGMLAGEC